MLSTVLTNIIALIVTLGILVTIHEYGHYWVARRCGVKVLRFSIGFGKPFKSWLDRNGTEWAIAPIPLGGYVKMLGQEDISIVDMHSTPVNQQHESFAFKPLWQRMAIVAAGPVANFILAIVVFWIINISYGVSGIAPVVHSVVEPSPAATAGLKSGDEIVAVDGTETIIWQHVTMQLLSRLGETGEINLTIKPGNTTGTMPVIISIQDWLAVESAPDPLEALGIVQWDVPPVVAQIVANGRAESGGLLPGDEILSVNGMPLRGWRHWVELV
ncbi:MAG: RIP metalloprotease RseP, partial [Pseudohongiellaceae bacterium]